MIGPTQSRRKPRYSPPAVEVAASPTRKPPVAGRTVRLSEGAGARASRHAPPAADRIHRGRHASQLPPDPPTPPTPGASWTGTGIPGRTTRANDGKRSRHAQRSRQDPPGPMPAAPPDPPTSTASTPEIFARYCQKK